MKPATWGQLLVVVVMALALISFLAITHAVSKTANAGIYEVEVSSLPSAVWIPSVRKGSDQVAPQDGREKSRR